jgi:hypothetical protein
MYRVLHRFLTGKLVRLHVASRLILGVIVLLVL